MEYESAEAAPESQRRRTMNDLDRRIAALTGFRNLVLVIIIAVPLAHVAVKGVTNVAYEVRTSR